MNETGFIRDGRYWRDPQFEPRIARIVESADIPLADLAAAGRPSHAVEMLGSMRCMLSVHSTAAEDGDIVVTAIGYHGDGGKGRRLWTATCTVGADQAGKLAADDPGGVTWREVKAVSLSDRAAQVNVRSNGDVAWLDFDLMGVRWVAFEVTSMPAACSVALVVSEI